MASAHWLSCDRAPAGGGRIARIDPCERGGNPIDEGTNDRRAKKEICRASGCLVGRAREVPAAGIGPGARCCNNGICEASYSGNGHCRPRSVSALASTQRRGGDVTAQSAAGSLRSGTCLAGCIAFSPRGQGRHLTNLRLSVAPVFHTLVKNWRPVLRAGERPTPATKSGCIGWAYGWIPMRIGSQTNA